MYINRGKNNFMMLDISDKEMSTIKDAFLNSRYYMLELLKMTDEKFIDALSIKIDQLPEIKKVLHEKIKFYETHVDKIMSYAQQPKKS